MDNLRKDLDARNKRLQDSAEDIRLLRKELHKKAEALHAAKAELKQLKQQVQQQLRELHITSVSQLAGFGCQLDSVSCKTSWAWESILAC